MLQVDFFWVYGIGAMITAAAATGIKQLRDSEKFINKYFITLVLFMAIFFGATGMVLLWQFPHWETMQVFWVHADIPLWFILLWFVTNITNAILAYGICWKLIRSNREYEAHLQWIIGYFIFFFVLIYGWDGTGWQRFTYDATVMGSPWTPGATMGLAWFGSNVAITLYILGVVFLPPYIYIALRFAIEGLKLDSKESESTLLKIKMVVYTLLGVGLTFLLALASAGLGWAFVEVWHEPISGGLLGIAIVTVVAYFLIFKKGRIFHKLINKFMSP